MSNPTCPDCGNEMSNAGHNEEGQQWHCENCEWLHDHAHDEAFHDTRREDWERDQYRRMDAEDLADGEAIDFPSDDDYAPDLPPDMMQDDLD